MRFGNLLFSIVHLMISLFVLFFGALLVGLYYAEGLRAFLANLLYDKPLIFFSIGCFLVFFGVIMLIGFYFMNRRKYYQLKMETSKTSIDQSIIKEYVETYWKEVFPNYRGHIEVVIHPKQKLELITEMPARAGDDETLLARIQNELGVLLARKLGYEKEFILTISEA